MKPTRIGIVGLSSKPGAWATLAHLPRLQESPNFDIVALCNSSIESTKAAIKAHNLPETTKAYSTYEAIASDTDVDLFVVSTRADTHYEVALPAMQAGRNVFIEWPLAANTDDARKMAALARQKGIKTMIGFQSRASPTIKKIKALIDNGSLGDIHSVNYTGVVNVWQNNTADERYWHFIDRRAGGNLLTIYGGHTLDAIMFAVGELKTETCKPLAVSLRRRISILKPDGSLSEEIEKDTPDQMILQGQFDRQPPAVVSFHLRAGARFDDDIGSTWRIYGTKGELVVRFVSAGPQMAQASSMRLHNFDTKKTEDITIDQGGEEWTKLPKQAQNIGRLYEAYAKEEDYGDFDLAVRRHELIDSFWNVLT